MRRLVREMARALREVDPAVSARIETDVPRHPRVVLEFDGRRRIVVFGSTPTDEHEAVINTMKAVRRAARELRP